MDLFGKFIIPSQQLRLSLNPFPPIKISWAELSFLLSRRISETHCRTSAPAHSPTPTPPHPPFFLFVTNALHFRGSALGTMPTSPCQKLSRTSFGLRRGRAGRMAQHVWSVDPVSTAVCFKSPPHLTYHLQQKNIFLPPEHIFSGLFFTCRALQNAQEDSDAELRVCFKRAYDVVLRHHHSFVIRSVVSVSFPHGFIPPLPSPRLTQPDAGCYPCCTPSR